VVVNFQTSLIGTVVTKKEMSSLMMIKQKLDNFVAEVKIGKGTSKFRLNETGLDLADEVSFFLKIIQVEALGPVTQNLLRP